ncbi:hypothetical protein BKA70DRAFT_1557945 [Coprinopsis sp. MPI-PUGE-AT-0042]|nr:hypothetical protein BKA70DRAFT_1557945 [Coprinopsis sp. MPI-PUGE-AT-0042]
MLLLFVSSALVASVSALGKPLSEGCSNALASASGNPGLSACLDIPGLAPIFNGDNSTSLIPSIDSWLTGFCGAPDCDGIALLSMVVSLTISCGEEFGNFGLDAFQSPPILRKAYPAIRRVICLKDGSENCVTKTLQAVESKIDTLTGERLEGQRLFESSEIAPDFYCTDCIKAALNVIVEGAPELAKNSTFVDDAEGVCGADFTNGEIPPNIVNAGSVQNEGSAAHRSNGLYLGVAGSSLTAVWSLL